MNLPGTTKMYPDKLSKSGRVVVFQGFSVTERLKDGVTSDQSLVVSPFLIFTLKHLVSYTTY